MSAAAQKADPVFVVAKAQAGTFHYLRAWFGGMPDWCYLRNNARRYSAETAAAELVKLARVGEAAAAVVLKP